LSVGARRVRPGQAHTGAAESRAEQPLCHVWGRHAPVARRVTGPRLSDRGKGRRPWHVARRPREDQGTLLQPARGRHRSRRGHRQRDRRTTRVRVVVREHARQGYYGTLAASARRRARCREGCVMRPRVLVVDDEAPVRFTVAEVLRDSGFDVTAADWVPTARGTAADQDVVVSDLSMPGESGLDLLAWMREHCPEVALVLLTARGNERIAVQAMKQGAWDYLSKPFENDELSLSVERAAERVRLRRSEQRRAAQNDVAQLIV